MESKQFTNLPIGLNPQLTVEIAQGLNDLLADLQVFQQNVRGFHWNVRGPHFFELHAQFDRLGSLLVDRADDVAERILTLAARPLHTFAEYMAKTDVPVISDVSDGVEAVKHCVAALSVLLVRERALLALAEKADDAGTSALLADLIREQEKRVWMFRAFIGA